MALEKQGRDSGKISGRIWKNEAGMLTQKWTSGAKYLDFNKIKTDLESLKQLEGTEYNLS